MHGETNNARRLRQFRQRQRECLSVLPVPVNAQQLTRALRSRKIIAADAQLDRTQLSNHVAALVATFSETEV